MEAATTAKAADGAMDTPPTASPAPAAAGAGAAAPAKAASAALSASAGSLASLVRRG